MKQSQFYYLLRRGLFGGGGIWAKYVYDFKARVIADGGTVESMSCLLADVAELGGSAQMELFWTGIILQDLIEIEDVSKPYIFKISATDGIGHLANQEYTGTVNTTVNDLLKSAIDAIGMADLYSSTDPYFATTVTFGTPTKCIQPPPMF